MPNDLAVGNILACPGVEPLVGFGVAIRKTEDARNVVQAGGIMEKNVLHHINAESRTADIGRIDIRKNEAIGRLIRGELRRPNIETEAGERDERFFEAASRCSDVTID